jgi:Spy/CpxP family protein refolding chaperone
MRFVEVTLAAVVLVLPGLAAGQAVPQPTGLEGNVGPPADLFAQGPDRPILGEMRPGDPVPPGPPPPGRMMGPGPGMWWRDSQAALRLALSEGQVARIEQTYLEHRLRLADLRANLEKQELSLQPLLDVEQPDEVKVAAQIDRITAARGRLEKEHALMLLDIRRVLSTDQWKRLQALQQERALASHVGHPPGPPEGPGPGAGRRPPLPPPR